MPAVQSIRPRRDDGFSLIELMIAITLGMLLVYAAMAGFRVASQSITSANRLAMENSLLRAGFHEALNEIDMWTAYDDPESTIAADQALRRAQMPFSQLPTTPIIMASSTATAYVYSESEADTGWDPTYPWPASSPRTWWRANAAEWHNSVGRSGDYTQFATIGGSTHPWLFNQMDMLHKGLGYYGFCDYLPPSMLYAYIGPDPNQKDKIDMVRDFVNAGTSFRNGDGGTSFAQGRYRCTKDTSYLLVPLKPLGGTGQITTGNIRNIYSTGVGTNEGAIKGFMDRSLSSRSQLTQKPLHWPEIKVQVARYVSYNRFVTLSKIGFTNSISGQPLELSFTAIGTTLRGARQQRKPGAQGSGAGWAKWWGPNEIDNDRHLDYNP
jgi:prepilin-type N-terminal cleavage/methylation domain-containing protein